jgi:hypothetical protein
MPQVSRTCASCRRDVPEDAVVCPECGADLPTSLIGNAVPATASETDALRDRLQAALGSGFELGARLGEGGFGVVYRARDVRLRRDVAVKLLRRELVSTEGFVERFEREAQALAALRHPNIVPVYSIGDKDELIYLVMPFVSGVTLTDYLRERGRLTLEEAEQILKAVGDALSAAHAVGLVHRDIKPDNIMLEGPNRLPLLMDFGIAKTGNTGAGAAGGGVGLTATGMVMGTPLYMSPEQATADPSVDSRSDIYSLGVLAYQMFTGQLPFSGESIYAVLSQHLTTPAPEARSLRPEIPPRISAALRRAMAKKPAERFQRVEEFLAALEGRGGRARRLAVPGSRTLLAAANLILLLGLAAAVWWKGSARVARAPVRAEIRAEGVWLRTGAVAAPWDKPLTLTSLGISGLEQVSLPARGKKPAATDSTATLFLKAVPPESGSITIDPIQLPARSLVTLKPAVAGSVQLSIGDSLPSIPVTVNGRIAVALEDQPMDTAAFHIAQIQLAATHGPLDFGLGFAGTGVARPLVPLDIVGVSFEDIAHFRSDEEASEQRVSTIDSGSIGLTIGNRSPHVLKKGEMLPLRGFKGSIRDVAVDSDAVSLTLEGTVDSIPASLGSVPTKLQVFVSEHALPSAAAGLVYITLLVLVGLYWKRSTR